MDPASFPTPSLYILLGLAVGATGVLMIVWQTGATSQALLTRRGVLAGGVLLILMAGLVVLTQLLAIFGGSYGGPYGGR